MIEGNLIILVYIMLCRDQSERCLRRVKPVVILSVDVVSNIEIRDCEC